MLLLLVKLDPGSSNSEDSGDPPSTRPIASYDGLECQYQTASYKTNSFKFMEITVMKFLILRLWLKLGRFETRMLKYRSWKPEASTPTSSLGSVKRATQESCIIYFLQEMRRILICSIFVLVFTIMQGVRSDPQAEELLRQCSGSNTKTPLIVGLIGGLCLVLLMLALLLWGYTAPEYAIHGHLSEKVDTYGFGIVVLEIISGRRCSDMMNELRTESLLPYAWKLYESGRHSKLIDETIDPSEYDVENAKKMIEIGLKCTQSPVSIRPAMSEVVVLLGIIKNGDIVAVKKLAIISARINTEFESEVRLISNVHHRNIIRLLGCSAKGPEKLLVYEYMENGSLDTFLYDFKDLLEHARGYIAPEYAIHGHLSEKVDTYAYGVMVLEIISGQRCSDMTNEPGKESLLQYAWKLYENDMHSELIDETLDPSEYEVENVKKIIEIALKCTQSPVSIRPTMSEVVVLLVKEGSVEQKAPSKPSLVQLDQNGFEGQKLPRDDRFTNPNLGLRLAACLIELV
uniref:Serine-threonine/tyrosine-protein kinase catalytic domain-containing protein n=1 Tax=Daucus carota subsp. sativus TaxID=79200 RepID=A0A166GQU2_DAUCS